MRGRTYGKINKPLTSRIEHWEHRLFVSIKPRGATDEELVCPISGNAPVGRRYLRPRGVDWPPAPCDRDHPPRSHGEVHPPGTRQSGDVLLPQGPPAPHWPLHRGDLRPAFAGAAMGHGP